MIFERHHSTSQNFFKITVSKNTRSFPLHIHKAYECYSVIKGEAKVTVDDKEYVLKDGESVLVFPYQSHSYDTAENTETWLCIFSPDLVGSYHSGRRIPKSNSFKLECQLPESCEGLLYRKVLCYNICAEFDENAEYIDSAHTAESLISKLLYYISENYKSNCSLLDLANHVGYDYNYISKVFKKATGLTFKEYLTDLRISEACQLLLHTEKSAREISEECGFGCQRSFNREFLNALGMTPVEYRKGQNPHQTAK